MNTKTSKTGGGSREEFPIALSIGGQSSGAARAGGEEAE
jgi:hypothetical protein